MNELNTFELFAPIKLTTTKGIKQKSSPVQKRIYLDSTIF